MAFDYIWLHVDVKVALIFIATLLVIYVLHLKSSRANLPPGPRGVPFLGSVPFVGSRADLTFGKWADKYGPVMYLKLGTQPTVILSTYEAVEQAFIKQAPKFNGRVTNAYTKAITEDSGIIFCNDLNKWNIYRKFGHKVLGSSELLGGSIEKAIQTEAKLLCELIKAKEETAFILEGPLSFSIGNVLFRIMAGETIEGSSYKDLEKVFCNTINGFENHRITLMLFMLFPWTRQLPFLSKDFKIILGELKLLGEVMISIINDHQKVYDANNHRDLIDLYLEKIKRQEFGFDVDHLIYVLKDFLAAGSETSTTSVRWILFHLITYPEVQEKVHREIDQVIGRDGCISNRVELHYTKAVIEEVFRCKAAVPLGVPRRTTDDVQLMGYKIPKDTQVIANISKVHHDTAIWTNPQVFNPERHLDENGRFRKSNKVIPFSVGQRNCLGKQLAITEVFVFTVAILQRFKVFAGPGVKQPLLEGELGVVYYPKKVPILFKER